MKTSDKIQTPFQSLMIAIVLLLVASACATRPHMPSTSKNLVAPESRIKPRYTDLTSLLRNVPTIKVTGSHQNAAITLYRNVKVASDTPLFIVDGVRLGNEYSFVYYSVRPEDVKRVTVLNDSEALATYGFSGNNGAIVIETIYSSGK